MSNDDRERFFAVDMTGGFGVARHRTQPVLDERAGWRIVSVGGRGLLRAERDGLPSVAIGRGSVVGIGPGAAYAAAMLESGEVVLTGLPSGHQTPLGLPDGSSPADSGYRWTGAGDLVMPVTTEPEADDPMVSWYLCSAPDWGCEAMDVPDQPRSEIAIVANFWNFVAVSRDVAAEPEVSSASAPAQPQQ